MTPFTELLAALTALAALAGFLACRGVLTITVRKPARPKEPAVPP